MPQVYTLDDSITDFFRDLKGVTRHLCDETAARIIGEPVKPCPIQGQFSYAVYAGTNQSKVIQFRVEHLDNEILKLAKSIHCQFVPESKCHALIGSENKLEVWESERMPGITYIESQMNSFPRLNSMINQNTWRQNLIIDYAK